jgi:tRNA pseudouridine38-40 synthase
MPRYFLEVSYKGTAYSGFQSQHNANTIQAEVEKGVEIILKDKLTMTGSSRTDTGVHALQNYFHFDTILPLEQTLDIQTVTQIIYKLNAILPADIVVKNIRLVPPESHCRFDALSREYNYYIYRQKDPFLKEIAFFFPYKLDLEKMQEAAALVKGFTDFTSFSKRNSQVKTFFCKIEKSNWILKDNYLIYNVKSNRFLRGMVRALTATMLKVGRGKISLNEFRTIIEAKDCTKASFAVPAHGLFLMQVTYPDKIMKGVK